uniref:Secreted protein n=1 Tax=Steinernema glaseri TaxID=37863 RepID=A0A1I7YS87_9BILA
MLKTILICCYCCSRAQGRRPRPKQVIKRQSLVTASTNDVRRRRRSPLRFACRRWIRTLDARSAESPIPLRFWKGRIRTGALEGTLPNRRHGFRL